MALQPVARRVRAAEPLSEEEISDLQDILNAPGSAPAEDDHFAQLALAFAESPHTAAVQHLFFPAFNAALPGVRRDTPGRQAMLLAAAAAMEPRELVCMLQAAMQPPCGDSDGEDQAGFEHATDADAWGTAAAWVPAIVEHAARRLSPTHARHHVGVLPDILARALRAPSPAHARDALRALGPICEAAERVGGAVERDTKLRCVALACLAVSTMLHADAPTCLIESAAAVAAGAAPASGAAPPAELPSEFSHGALGRRRHSVAGRAGLVHHRNRIALGRPDAPDAGAQHTTQAAPTFSIASACRLALRAWRAANVDAFTVLNALVAVAAAGDSLPPPPDPSCPSSSPAMPPAASRSTPQLGGAAASSAPFFPAAAELTRPRPREHVLGALLIDYSRVLSPAQLVVVAVDASCDAASQAATGVLRGISNDGSGALGNAALGGFVAVAFALSTAAGIGEGGDPSDGDCSCWWPRPCDGPGVLWRVLRAAVPALKHQHPQLRLAAADAVNAAARQAHDAATRANNVSMQLPAHAAFDRLPGRSRRPPIAQPAPACPVFEAAAHLVQCAISMESAAQRAMLWDCVQTVIDSCEPFTRARLMLELVSTCPAPSAAGLLIDHWRTHAVAESQRAQRHGPPARRPLFSAPPLALAAASCGLQHCLSVRERELREQRRRGAHSQAASALEAIDAATGAAGCEAVEDAADAVVAGCMLLRALALRKVGARGCHLQFLPSLSGTQVLAPADALEEHDGHRVVDLLRSCKRLAADRIAALQREARARAGPVAPEPAAGLRADEQRVRAGDSPSSPARSLARCFSVEMAVSDAEAALSV